MRTPRHERLTRVWLQGYVLCRDDDVVDLDDGSAVMSLDVAQAADGEQSALEAKEGLAMHGFSDRRGATSPVPGTRLVLLCSRKARFVPWSSILRTWTALELETLCDMYAHMYVAQFES